jgi:hypothetical protein
VSTVVPGIVPVLAAIALVAAACTASLPPEADALGLQVDPVIPPSSISEAEAIAAATEAQGYEGRDVTARAWLRRVTETASLSRFNKRAVWIVLFTGVTNEGPVPSSAPGASGVPERILLTHTWVFIDADTGAHIATTYSE